MKKLISAIFITNIILFSLIVSGCTILDKDNSISKREAEKIIIDKMLEKYNENVTIESIEKSYNTNQLRAIPVGYDVIAKTKDNDTFEIYINEDGTKIQDKYAQVLFEDQVNNHVVNILSSISNINYKHKDTLFFLEEQTWNKESFQEYLKNGNYYAIVNINLLESTVEEAAKKAKEIENFIVNNNLNAMIGFNYNENNLTHNVGKNYTDKIEYEDLIKAFSK